MAKNPLVVTPAMKPDWVLERESSERESLLKKIGIGTATAVGTYGTYRGVKALRDRSKLKAAKEEAAKAPSAPTPSAPTPSAPKPPSIFNPQETQKAAGIGWRAGGVKPSHGEGWRTGTVSPPKVADVTSPTTGEGSLGSNWRR